MILRPKRGGGASVDGEADRCEGRRPRAGPFPGAPGSRLDHWLAAFGIPAVSRHDALGDAFATGAAYARFVNEAKRQRLETVEALLKTERAGRWLARR
jgi:DNA polymerase III epsilon subunit-like protein